MRKLSDNEIAFGLVEGKKYTIWSDDPCKYHFITEFKEYYLDCSDRFIIGLSGYIVYDLREDRPAVDEFPYGNYKVKTYYVTTED
jgi:hypothetical protein